MIGVLLKLLGLLFRRPLRYWWVLAGVTWQMWRGAWSAPATHATGYLVTNDDWTEIVNDILYLFSGRGYAQYIVDEGADYTTTSTTFTNVDGTDLALTANIKSGMALVYFHGSVAFSATNQSILFNITMGGADVGTSGGLAVARSASSASDGAVPISIVMLVVTGSAGNKVFRLEWRTSTGTATLYASAGTSNLNVSSVFGVIEVGNG